MGLEPLNLSAPGFLSQAMWGRIPPPPLPFSLASATSVGHRGGLGRWEASIFQPPQPAQEGGHFTEGNI